MIDPFEEELVPLAKIPEVLPRGQSGKKIHRATGFRWALKGIRGIRLETIKVGGSRFTSHEALSRFIVHLSAGAQNAQLIASSLESTQATSKTPAAVNRGRTQRRINAILNTSSSLHPGVTGASRAS